VASNSYATSSGHTGTDSFTAAAASGTYTENYTATPPVMSDSYTAAPPVTSNSYTAMNGYADTAANSSAPADGYDPTKNYDGGMGELGWDKFTGEHM
jgi:hypothetical protein